MCALLVLGCIAYLCKFTTHGVLITWPLTCATCEGHHPLPKLREHQTALPQPPKVRVPSLHLSPPTTCSHLYRWYLSPALRAEAATWHWSTSIPSPFTSLSTELLVLAQIPFSQRGKGPTRAQIAASKQRKLQSSTSAAHMQGTRADYRLQGQACTVIPSFRNLP
jgi:hypothetical protein